MAFNETGLFATRTAYNVARVRGVPFGIICPGPGGEFFCLCDVGETYCWSEFMDRLHQGQQKLSDDQLRYTLDFIKSRTAKKSGTAKINFISDRHKFILRALRSLYMDSQHGRHDKNVSSI